MFALQKLLLVLDCLKCQISFTFSEDLKALKETEDKIPFEPKLLTTNIKTLPLSQLRQRLTVHMKRAKLKQVSSPATHYFFSELMGLVSLVGLVGTHRDQQTIDPSPATERTAARVITHFASRHSSKLCGDSQTWFIKCKHQLFGKKPPPYGSIYFNMLMSMFLWQHCTIKSMVKVSSWSTLHKICFIMDIHLCINPSLILSQPQIESIHATSYISHSENQPSRTT